MTFNTFHYFNNGVMDLEKTRKYKSISIWDKGKVIATFKENLFTTADKKIIAILKNRNKYEFISWRNKEVEEVEEKEEKEENKTA